jgi:hypothetical protein
VDPGDVESTTAFVGRVLLPVEIGLRRFGIERRAILKFDTWAQLEGPGLEVIRVSPGQRELRLRLALFVKISERIENRGSRRFRRRIEDADLQRIETGNIQLKADGMLPPCFWAWASPVNKAMPNAVVRKICASLLERDAVFICYSLRGVVCPVFRIVGDRL